MWRLFLALASSVVSGTLSLVGIRATAAGVESIGAALGVVGGTLSLVGIGTDTARVEVLLALGVGGGQGNGGEGQSEEGGEADHCEVCGGLFEESGLSLSGLRLDGLFPDDLKSFLYPQTEAPTA